MKQCLRVCAIAMAVLVLAGCATTLRVNLWRPAELNLGNAKTISVLPFGLSTDLPAFGGDQRAMLVARFLGFLGSPNSEERMIAQKLSTDLNYGLLQAGFMTVVPAEQVSRFLEGQLASPPVDVYLTGMFTHFYDRIEAKTEKRKINNVEQNVIVYYRVLEFNLTYQVIDARTNTIIAYKERSFRNESATMLEYQRVPATRTLLEPDFSRMVSEILRSLQPYEETKYLSLANDKTKDPAMKAADDLAKAGRIDEAMARFQQIWTTTGNFAAGYNVAILLQAGGRLEEALALMQAVYLQTGERRAQSAIDDIKREMTAAARLQAQLEIQ